MMAKRKLSIRIDFKLEAKKKYFPFLFVQAFRKKNTKLETFSILRQENKARQVRGHEKGGVYSFISIKI